MDYSFAIVCSTIIESYNWISIVKWVLQVLLGNITYSIKRLLTFSFDFKIPFFFTTEHVTSGFPTWWQAPCLIISVTLSLFIWRDKFVWDCTKLFVERHSSLLASRDQTLNRDTLNQNQVINLNKHYTVSIAFTLNSVFIYFNFYCVHQCILKKFLTNEKS